MTMPRGGAVRLLGGLLGIIASVLTVVAILSRILNGVELHVGPIRISATDSARVAFQAALVWMVAVFVSPHLRVRPGVVMISLAAVLVTATADSTPRRVGDGAEYLAMALNVSRLRPPALSSDDRRELLARMAATPGFEVATLDVPPLVGVDGRQDFSHFWLFSALVSPLVALVDALGIHPNYAFTLFNGALLLAMSWWLVARGWSIAAALVVAGPLIWWIDKAHAEVFLFVMMAFAILRADKRPHLALVAAAIAAAQNSGASVVLGAVIVYVLMTHARDRATLLSIAGAILIAAMPSLYYLWHLGTWSPLVGTIERGLPGMRAVLTLLIDLNLGLLPYAPVLVAIAVYGIRAQPTRVRVLIAMLLLALLIVLSRPQNLNHGGSPGMSRYALWLLACAMPFIADGSLRLERSRPLVMAIGLMLVVATSWYAFRPELGDRGGAAPSVGAAMIWTRWPWLDDPLPEVFAERVSGVDGEPPVPVAIASCSKVLIRGDGTDAWWPFPCTPRHAPPECLAAHALCYANADRFVTVPRQPSFRFDPAKELSWTTSDRGRLPALRSRLGPDARAVRLGLARRTDGGEAVSFSRIVEGQTGTAVWVRPLARSESRLRIRVDVPSTIEVQHAATGAIDRMTTVASGTHIVALPFDERMLVLVVDAP